LKLFISQNFDFQISDEFCDDIRFSSRRSSHLSIVPGPGAPDFQNSLRIIITLKIHFYFKEIFNKKISNQDVLDFRVTNHPEQLDINNFDIAGFGVCFFNF